jgi:hypothetical protein
MGDLQLSRLCRLCQNVMLVLQGGAGLGWSNTFS